MSSCTHGEGIGVAGGLDALAAARATLSVGMREKATLRLDGGEELRVEVDRDDLGGDEIVVRRAADNGAPADGELIAVIDEHLANVQRRPAGTTDRLLKADRERPY